MIKQGIYKEPSTNQRTFCYEINPPDYIKVWFEEPNGKPQDHWWDQEITPVKFHWLVEQWNEGNIAKLYNRPARHINSLLQLTHSELWDVFNYFTYVTPHYRWNSKDFMVKDLRPIWKDHKIIGEVVISRAKADEYNAKPNAEVYYGFTDEEYFRKMF